MKEDMQLTPDNIYYLFMKKIELYVTTSYKYNKSSDVPRLMYDLHTLLCTRVWLWLQIGLVHKLVINHLALAH